MRATPRWTRIALTGMVAAFVPRQSLDRWKGLARRHTALHAGASKSQRIPKRITACRGDRPVASEKSTNGDEIGLGVP